jgi:hypothetical protein
MDRILKQVLRIQPSSIQIVKRFAKNVKSHAVTNLRWGSKKYVLLFWGGFLGSTGV